MQWLIDLVIEAIGIPPVYIDRGDPNGHDYDENSLAVRNVWTELDLSAIVPAGAQAVNVDMSVNATSVNRKFRLRRHGNIFGTASRRIRTQAAGVAFDGGGAVAIDNDRKIDYNIDLIGITVIRMTVLGWWL